MLKEHFTRDVCKAMVMIISLLVLCKFTMGGVAILVALMGVVFAIQRKGGYLAVCYVMFQFFSVFNRTIVGISSVFLMTARMGNLFMVFAMMLVGAAFSGGRTRDRLPIGWIFAYLFVACLSSLDGWMPLISYLKIFQFFFFILGLYFIVHLIQLDPKALYQLRCAFMAFSLIMIVGSLLSKFVPSLGYSMMESRFMQYDAGITAKEMLQGGGMVLFNGLTYHSQALPAIVAILGTWVLCDMLFVERKFTLMHLACLVCAPVLLFLSRSRGGFLDMVVVVSIVFLLCLPKAKLSGRLKSKLISGMFVAICLLVVAAVVSQVKDQSISKWLRKTEDVGGDNRSLKEAFTDSRMGLLDENLHDFSLNPLLGMGFQVASSTPMEYQMGWITWYSAPIEKGVTPYVILGETGVVGSIVFLIFLGTFYATCWNRRYLSLLTSFSCVLTANLADSTLFSPGGIGGFLWIVSCIGAFSTDLLAKRMNESAIPQFPVG